MERVTLLRGDGEGVLWGGNDMGDLVGDVVKTRWGGRRW